MEHIEIDIFEQADAEWCLLITVNGNKTYYLHRPSLQAIYEDLRLAFEGGGVEESPANHIAAVLNVLPF